MFGQVSADVQSRAMQQFLTGNRCLCLLSGPIFVKGGSLRSWSSFYFLTRSLDPEHTAVNTMLLKDHGVDSKEQGGEAD